MNPARMQLNLPGRPSLLLLIREFLRARDREGDPQDLFNLDDALEHLRVDLGLEGWDAVFTEKDAALEIEVTTAAGREKAETVLESVKGIFSHAAWEEGRMRLEWPLPALPDPNKFSLPLPHHKVLAGSLLAG